MSGQLLKTTIKILEVETKLTQSGKTMFKVKGSDNHSYQVWQFKQDGQDNVAFVSLSNFPNMGVGKTFDITYKEDYGNYHGNPVTYRTIVQVFLKREQSMPKTELKPTEDEKWNQIAFGKCKHAFLIEAYKQKADIDKAENEAELWAAASMRIKHLSVNQPVKKQDDEEYFFEEDIVDDEIKVENFPF